jgi:suppressor of ftsI
VIRSALGILMFGAAFGAAPLAAQRPCAPAEVAHRPSRDLYCIELISAVADSARGTAELNWPGGPFTVAVGVDGTHRWRLTLALAGLPESMLAGPRAGFVAWVTPPSLDSFIKLGVVKNGETALAPVVELDRFYVHVTAEADTTVREPVGRPVLRGESAGNRLRPADNYQFFLGALDPSTGGVRPATGAAGHAGHGASAPRDSLGWTGVPMYPGLDMLPSEMSLRPAERAWRPPDDPSAPLAKGRQVVRLGNGDTLDLTAGVVRRSIAGRSFTMFGFNGQHPGPLLVVSRAATVTVRFRNDLPLPSAVHWHGLRLDNRSDGVPGLTQDPVPPGGSFTYTLTFPDAGVYWYHPHVREDLQQDLGLYGNIFVRPRARPPVDAQEFLILDDLLVGEEGLVPWGGEGPTHAAMGRFGNTFLVNGEPEWRGRARRGEVVRYYLTNASNTRTFNLSFAGARMKLIGSDLGNYLAPQWVESVVIAPAERYVVDVKFGRATPVLLLNRVRALDHLYGRFFSEVDTLGRIEVAGSMHTMGGATFEGLSPFGVPDTSYRAAMGDSLQVRTLEARVTFTGLPFVSQRLMTLDSIYFNPVEWAGTMPGMNWATTGPQARWTLRDPATGLENDAIQWRFRRGEMVRLRLVGVRDVLHAMQHPIHLHGQRFVVLAVNGVPNDIPVWKDTALLPAGGTLDLLVEMSNPGRWMLHCHIAEHLQSGMAMIFDVED